MKPTAALPTFLLLFGAIVQLHLNAQDLSVALITTNARYEQAVEMNTMPPDATQLWNGHDLTGWKLFFTNDDVDVSSTWSASNDVLRLSGKPYGYIHTKSSFSNYHLHVEWRWPGVTNGNSGVFVHFDGHEAIWPVSVECQLKSGAAGELVGLGNVDFLAPTISNRKRAKLTTSHEKPIGEWNSYDIYCLGDNVTTDVNGFRKNSISKVSVSSGGIGLQLEGAPIEFRNLWLEPL